MQDSRFSPDTVARFWSKVDRTEDCWLWTGWINKGYGRWCPDVKNRKTASTHRYAYELLVGPIPDGLTLDHLCRNKACVNPAHLEPVTARENIQRARPHCAAKSTHCRHGHEWTPENTFLHGNRVRCRECRKVQDRKARAARAA